VRSSNTKRTASVTESNDRRWTPPWIQNASAGWSSFSAGARRQGHFMTIVLFAGPRGEAVQSPTAARFSYARTISTRAPLRFVTRSGSAFSSSLWHPCALRLPSFGFVSQSRRRFPSGANCSGFATKFGRQSGSFVAVGRSGLWGLQAVDHDAFHDGYIAGWRSVRGNAEDPDVPACPEFTGMVMYLVGFSRGVRDATVVQFPNRRSPSAPPR
jgi:hypothetical protein